MDAKEALDRLATLTTWAPDEVRTELEAIARALDADAVTEHASPLGRFQDLGALGAGGMGEVRRVRDPVLGRTVAMKILAVELDDALRARFLEEARVSGQLQHPAIVPVHELGTLPDGRPYFTMREVHGRTLAEVIARGEWPRRRLLDALLRVVEAVAYAHARGVVHRDLKPSNIMVGDFGEVFVLDWGIAKVLGSVEAPETLRDAGTGEAWTRYGSVMGTPVYMAPEQAAGEPDAIGPATDVWGLGVVLHEILTGRAPLQGDAFVLMARLLDPALQIERIPTEVPVDDALWELCEACLARDPAARPADAGAVAAALQAFLEGARSRERALARVAEAQRHWPEADALRARAAALLAESRRVLHALEPWAHESDRHAGWALEDEARTLRARAELAELAGEQGVGAALAEVPTLPEAHAALAAHYRRQTGPRAEALLRQHAEALPESHPDRAGHLAWLDGTATLTLRTTVPAAVVLERYELRNRLLVPVPVQELDTLDELSIGAGSWRLRLQAEGRPEVLYPMSLGRGEHLELPELDLPEAIPDGTVYVAPGWFVAGGDDQRSRRRLWCDGFVIGRFPVTMAQLCVFLNDLVARGREDEALRHAPQMPMGRYGAGPLLLPRDDDGRFHPGADPDGDVIEADWPAFCVEWSGAVAYTAWLRERTGLPWRLPGDLEWEKAARGADGRSFPWGDQQDPSRCNCRDSHPGDARPVGVDTFPLDESPFGMRGAAGNVRDWCADAYVDGWSALDGDRVVPPPVDPPHAPRVVGRGGGWPMWPGGCGARARVEDRTDYRHPGVGFRVACSW